MGFEMESGTRCEMRQNMTDTDTTGQGHKQYKRRHGSLKRVEAHDYIMCN